MVCKACPFQWVSVGPSSASQVPPQPLGVPPAPAVLCCWGIFPGAGGVLAGLRPDSRALPPPGPKARGSDRIVKDQVRLGPRDAPCRPLGISCVVVERPAFHHGAGRALHSNGPSNPPRRHGDLRWRWLGRVCVFGPSSTTKHVGGLQHCRPPPPLSATPIPSPPRTHSSPPPQKKLSKPPPPPPPAPLRRSSLVRNE